MIKAPSNFVVPESITAHNKQWICRSHIAIKRELLPAQAKANNLDLGDVPTGDTISLRIPFMKMAALVANSVPLMDQLSIY